MYANKGNRHIIFGQRAVDCDCGGEIIVRNQRKLDELFNGLMQRAFTGELVA
jgi:hypothetical protein